MRDNTGDLVTKLAVGAGIVGGVLTLLNWLTQNLTSTIITIRLITGAVGPHLALVIGMSAIGVLGLAYLVDILALQNRELKKKNRRGDKNGNNKVVHSLRDYKKQKEFSQEQEQGRRAE